MTIYYVSEDGLVEAASQQDLRNRRWSTKVLDHVVGGIEELMGEEPTIWMANKDIGDDTFDEWKLSGCRTRRMA